MPRKTDVPSSPRALNKAERETRRDKIVARWEGRSVRRRNEEWFLETAAEEDMSLARFAHHFLEVGIYGVDSVDSVRKQMVAIRGTDEWALVRYLARVIQLKEMPYDEFLQTNEWTYTAENAKARYGGKCALDDSHPAEDAHHRTYVRRGRELADDVIPLCRACHKKFHNR